MFALYTTDLPQSPQRKIRGHRATARSTAEGAEKGLQRPAAFSPRSTMQVDVERATRAPAELVMSHSVRPTVFPRLTTRPTARSFSFQTGRRKLIFSSRVVKDSSSARVEAK